MIKRQRAEPLEKGDTAPKSVTDDRVDVLFRLRVDPAVHHVAVVGDFNGWSHTSHPMTRVGDCFERTIELQRGGRCRYRYLIDSDRWENDWEADEYEANEYGGDDSVRCT